MPPVVPTPTVPALPMYSALLVSPYMKAATGCGPSGPSSVWVTLSAGPVPRFAMTTLLEWTS